MNRQAEWIDTERNRKDILKVSLNISPCFQCYVPMALFSEIYLIGFSSSQTPGKVLVQCQAFPFL